MEKYQEIAIEMIKESEGFSSELYRCPAGKLTIGYGHNVEANPLTNDQIKLLSTDGTITEENATKLLLDVLPKYENGARRLVEFEGLDDVRRAVCIDMTYNLGEGGFGEFKNTRRFINDHDFNNAWKGLRASRWFKQVGYRGIRNVAMMRDGEVYTYADIEHLRNSVAQ